MKSLFKFKKLLKDKKAVFGLTSVQQFFAIILAVALLAYVIVIIMGTLSNSTILPTSSLSARINSEAGSITTTGYTLAAATIPGFKSPVILSIINTTSGLIIPSGNYTLSAAGFLKNATATNFAAVQINYTYSYNSPAVNNANGILSNTSSGIVSFFGNITPVYAILAILVIILVLVVLVRVVTGGNQGRQSGSQQL